MTHLKVTQTVFIYNSQHRFLHHQIFHLLGLTFQLIAQHLILKSSRLLSNYQVDNEPIGLRRYQQGIFGMLTEWQVTLMIKPLQVTNKE